MPGATHLFEGPGTLEQVSDLATDWLSCATTKQNLAVALAPNSIGVHRQPPAAW